MLHERIKPSNFDSQVRRLNVNPEISDIEDADFVYSLPFSDLNGWIAEGSFISDAASLFNLWRTAGLRQLGFLTAVGSQPDKTYFRPFTHDRHEHMLTTAVMTKSILRQASFPAKRIREGTLASLIHDVKMPGGGDSMKSLDPSALNEEDHWMESVSDKEILFMAQHDIDPKEVDKAIHNEGVLGDVLDKADRISYTVLDLANLGIKPPPKDGFGNHLDVKSGYTDPYYSDYEDIVRQDPKVGDIYSEIRIDRLSHDVYFTDMIRLGRFLRLRAMNSQRIYSHPINQARDQMMVALVRPMWGKQITPQILRSINDEELDQMIQTYYRQLDPFIDIRDWRFGDWKAEYKLFESEEEAGCFKYELNQSENMLIIGSNRITPFKTGDHYLVKKGKNLVTFGDADDKTAADLSIISQMNAGYFVYYVDGSENTPTNRLLRLVNDQVSAAIG